MRMKRFSSALCLVDQHQQHQHHQKQQVKRNSTQQQQQAQLPATTSSGLGIRRSGSPRRGTTSSQTSSELAQTSRPGKGANYGQLLLASHEDPMVLARQRRPSASNQGSVNVDQQGKCTIYEVAKLCSK